MRTFNVKAAIICVGAVIVVASSTHLLHSYQVARHAGTLLKMAEAAWNATPRRDQEAIQSLKSYLVLRPNDCQAAKELASWLAQSGRTNAAANLMEELLRVMAKQKSPDQALSNEVRQNLVQIYMRGNPRNWPAAETHLKVLLEGFPLDHPEQIDHKGAGLLWLLGTCQIKQDRCGEAVKSFEAALANPQNRGRYDIYHELAMTYRFAPAPLRNVEKGEKVMAEMIAVEENANSSDARDFYAHWLEELGDAQSVPDRAKSYYQAALEQAKAALKLKSEDHSGLYVAAECESRLGNIAFAEKAGQGKLVEAEQARLDRSASAMNYATQGLKIAPQDSRFYVLSANISTSIHRRAEAIAVLKQGIKTLDSPADRSTLLWHLANIYLDGPGGGAPVDVASIAEANECIRQLEEYHFSPVEIDFFKARVLYATNDWGAALKAFNDVLPKLTELPVRMKCLYSWIGDCYAQQGDPDKADYSYHRALKIDLFDFHSHDGVARIYLENGRYKDAVKEYATALTGNPHDNNAWFAYVNALVIDNVHRKASERDWDSVRRELMRALQFNPNDGRIAQLAASILTEMKIYEGAQKILEGFRKDTPKNADAWIGLANLEARHDNLAKAQEIMDEARRQVGDHYRLRLARAAFALRERGDRAVSEIEDLAKNIEGYTNDEKIQLLQGLMNALMAIQENDRAKALGRQVALLQPHDAMIRYRLLELDRQTHNFREPDESLADMDRLLDEIEKVAGRGPLWHYGKAERLRLEAARAKPELLDEAMKHAAEAQRQRLTWSRPHVLMGEICELQGKNEEALQHFLDASVNGERDLDFNNHLLQMLYDRQRKDDADKVFERLTRNEVAVSPDIAKRETEFEVRWGQLDRALQSASRHYDLAADDYAAHLQHGRILRVLALRARLEGRQEKMPEILPDAEKSLRRAIELAPTNANCRVELVLLLVAANEKARAQKEAAEAEQMIPSEVRSAAMGYIYEALGDVENARKGYEAAAERNGDSAPTIRTLAEFYVRNGESQRAAPLIDRLLSGQLAVSDADRLTARRMKAALLIAQGYPKHEEALSLIEQNLRAPQISPDDLRFKAQIVLADPAQARSPKTLELVESLVKTAGEPDSRDRYQLAHLYLRLGRWDECREQMEILVGGQSEPAYVADYVKMLLDQNHLLDAKLWLERYEKISEPGVAVPLRAELMFLQKSWGAITPFLLSYLDQPNAVPKDRADRVALVARLFEDFGNRLTAPNERATAQGYFAEAGKLLEQNAKSRPGGEVALAAFYARRSRLPDAIEQLANGAAKATTPEVAVAALDIINAEKITSPQLQQVEKILTAAAGARKQPVLLLSALGVLKIVQGQNAEAEDIYRRVIAANPSDFRAYNNLAVLLALSGKNLDEALTLVNRAIGLVGPLPSLLDSRAVVLIARGEPQGALQDLESILTAPPKEIEPSWRFHKAWAHQKSGSEEDARDELRKARLDKDNPLDRSKVDAPERPIYDQLIKDLASKE